MHHTYRGYNIYPREADQALRWHIPLQRAENLYTCEAISPQFRTLAAAREWIDETIAMDEAMEKYWSSMEAMYRDYDED